MSGTDELIRGLARKLANIDDSDLLPLWKDDFERVLRESGLAEILDVVEFYAEEYSAPHKALAALRSKVVPQ